VFVKASEDRQPLSDHPARGRSGKRRLGPRQVSSCQRPRLRGYAQKNPNAPAVRREAEED